MPIENQFERLRVELGLMFREQLRAGNLEAARAEVDALGAFVADRKRRKIAIERGRRLDTGPPPVSGGKSAGVCGKRCDHDSECLLLADHDPPNRHETQHGCVFYDGAPDDDEPAEGDVLPEGYRR